MAGSGEMNTRKYPRTLNEAFGPYTGHHICEPAPQMLYPRLFNWVYTIVVCAAMCVLWWVL